MTAPYTPACGVGGDVDHKKLDRSVVLYPFRSRLRKAANLCDSLAHKHVRRAAPHWRTRSASRGHPCQQGRSTGAKWVSRNCERASTTRAILSSTVCDRVIWDNCPSAV